MAHVERQSRSERRQAYDEHTRITLLEDDQDMSDVRQLAIEMKLDQIRTWLVAGAISFASSAILLGINIALTLGG